MGYIPDATLEAMKGAHNIGLFFFLDTSPALHLWWGVGDIEARIPNLDIAGTTYYGAGIMTDIPDALEVLFNASSERVDWSINGVRPELTVNIDADAPSVVGKLAVFGFAPLDTRWQMQGDIVETWAGVADFWAMEQPQQTDRTKPKTRRLTLSTRTGDSSRALPYYSTYTNAIQNLVSPTDRFCERVARYFLGYTVRWPRFS